MVIDNNDLNPRLVKKLYFFKGVDAAIDRDQQVDLFLAGEFGDFFV